MRSRIIAFARAMIITSGLTFTGQSAAQGLAPDPAHPVITTSGSGGVHIPPDGASVIIAVESRAATASAAAALNATATTSTLASLRAAGLTASQLSTTGFSVGVDYRRAIVPSVVQTSAGSTVVQPPVTFVATNGVRADVHALATLSKVIDAALAGGATQIGQLQFTSTGMEQARRAALAQAVESARSDADAIARAAGGSLGPLVEITSADNMGFSGKYMQIRLRGADTMAPPPPPTPLTPGDVPVNANVTARWVFVPGH
ncbi:MAG: SIMPL domain-containing protein [Gemmatimonadaceae bacterium]